ncbi:MAG: DUF4258 domain-containing protein [Alphaproteobacteria bacterium]|nr:DUF4258 domain-containing protein [Alphaproteobacteria bacterium]
MDVGRIIFTGHAVHRMFERGLSVADVQSVIRYGEIIEDYPDDMPHPIQLLLGYCGGRPVHVVLAAEAATRTGWVVTAYIPSIAIWEDYFRTRRLR